MAEGATGGTKIERLKKGDKTRTAQHADVMNEIIDKLNTLLAIQVVPASAGEFFYSDGNTVLLLNKTTTLDLNVCIEGAEKVVTFVVQGEPRDP